MAAVAIVINGIIVIINKVPAAHIVNIAVAVIINPVPGGFARVDPTIRCQVRVGVINARVNDPHDYAWTPGKPRCPGFHRVDIRSGRASCLATIVQPPQLAKVRIIARVDGIHQVVRLGVIDPLLKPRGGQDL